MQTDNRSRSLYFSDSITQAMNLIFDFPLTIIEAPMGYGKTTAVREQLAGLNANILLQRIFDGSTDIFWKAFCRLFSHFDSEGSVRLEQLGFPNDGVSCQESLKLIEDFKLPAKTVLVLDDYHLLNQAEVNRFVEFLVVNEIENLHIVLIARYIELPGMDELALKGYLHHIDKEAFELGPGEIMKYYRLCGINLKDTEAERLYALTEGWISALYLMMLSYRESGGFDVSSSIFGLVENTIYNPFSGEIKEFLLTLCHFDNFTMGQAEFMWGNEHAREYLSEVTEKNAFVNYDPNAGTYQMHNIFTSLLKELFETKAGDFKRAVYEKAGHWYVKAEEYLTAMHYFYSAGDFDNLLLTIERDRGYSFGNEQKELVIRYFEECPVAIKQRHPIAVLHYALTMMTLNETGLFQKICEEFVSLIRESSLGAAAINRMMGEFELLLSFTRYNDIMGMAEHFNKSWELLNGPSDLMDTKSNWTFGSPSVLYMFYRESGKLADEVNEMHAAMPYYYRLTNGHGMGAESLMEAEWFLNRCDYQNAEITAYKALYRAESALQPNMVLCAQFILARLALIKGDYNALVNRLGEMHERVQQYKAYELIHTVDMCAGFAYACLQQRNKIPEWLVRGDFNSSRLLFPSLAFSNIIYGRALLIKGDYTKLLGAAGQFMGIASVFPNILANLYTLIHIAAANERIFRRDEAVEALKQALDMSIPDKMYMPFVENFDYINPLLEALYSRGFYREDIARIQELSAPYQKVMEQIKKEYLNEDRPKLTARETEIARLAAEGYSNKGIGERLYITQNTVKTQLKNVFEKLGINSRSLLKQHMDSN